MEKQQCILLYSKYSQQSKRFMDMLKQSPVDFTTEVKLNPLCIDNEKIRQRILNSQQIDIKVVPCILVVYKDGGVEKYEGGTAFRWAEEVIRSLAPPPPPIPREPPIVSQEQYEPKKLKQKRQPHPPQQRQPLPPPQQRHQQIAATSIDDLNSESEEKNDEEDEEEYNYKEEEEVRENFSDLKPPAPIRLGVGNYDVKGEFGKLEEPNRNVKRGIKASTEPGIRGGKGSLMATAMEMQKLRERDEPAHPSRVSV